ncbi:growth arrest and DNA damage-inducible proteins-interacting protein 1 [Hippoglossus hippoglossus]|uniref:growth arrest and DNA damage-inducible proteins-interacting protein 1 n=1 Tax=Hippoglossus hippoglossus TaxID=8267 RepID=UPI00148E847C|nr:growth arrest and DNA damage-inducible proteins-interacting protein 1 [Hippoglossus hippoglossus]
MAASVLCRRTAVLCRTFRGVSPQAAGCQCGTVLQTAGYNPKPLRLNLRDPHIPDKRSDATPEWQKTARYDGKLFGRYGSASGVDPTSLWPSPGQLDGIIAEEKQWQPPLEEMLRSMELQEKEETEKRRAKERVIAANMAKMPKMISDWRREKRETKQRLKEDKDRRGKLLNQARERFGYALDPRSPKFVEMVAEIEAEDKKKRKLMKRRQKEEQTAGAPVTSPAASS